MKKTAHSRSTLKTRNLPPSGLLAATLAILLAVTVSEAAEVKDGGKWKEIQITTMM